MAQQAIEATFILFKLALRDLPHLHYKEFEYRFASEPAPARRSRALLTSAAKSHI